MVLSIFIRNHTPLARVSHFLILVQPATCFIWAKVSPKMYRNNLPERSQWRKPLVDMDFMGNNLLLLTICVPSKSWECGWGGQRTCCLCTPVGVLVESPWQPRMFLLPSLSPCFYFSSGPNISSSVLTWMSQTRGEVCHMKNRCRWT